MWEFIVNEYAIELTDILRSAKIAKEKIIKKKMSLRKHSECRQGLRVRLEDMINYSQRFLTYKCYLYIVNYFDNSKKTQRSTF